MPWITFTGPTQGTGPATVNYNVGPNTGAARTGRMLLAGIEYAFGQDGGVPDLTYATPLPVSCVVTPVAGAPDSLTVTIRVRNIGTGDAGASTTRVTFTVFSSVPTIVVDTATGAIPAGGATGTTPADPTFTMNDADSCYADLDENGTEDCNFSVAVDVLGAVTESDESAASNSTTGQCSRLAGGGTLRRAVRRSN